MTKYIVTYYQDFGLTAKTSRMASGEYKCAVYNSLEEAIAFIEKNYEGSKTKNDTSLLAELNSYVHGGKMWFNLFKAESIELEFEEVETKEIKEYVTRETKFKGVKK